jgi:hypothetical protein
MDWFLHGLVPRRIGSYTAWLRHGLVPVRIGSCTARLPILLAASPVTFHVVLQAGAARLITFYGHRLTWKIQKETPESATNLK